VSVMLHHGVGGFLCFKETCGIPFLRFKVRGPLLMILNSWWRRWCIPFKSWGPLPQFVCICAI